MIKVGLLAWKLCTEKLVLGGVGLLVGRNLGVYRKRMPEGGKRNK